MLNLGEQSFGGRGSIGHSQRNAAGPDVIACGEFLVMFFKIASLPFQLVASSALTSDLSFLGSNL